MTPQELKQHRIQLFRDCAAWRKPERVPFLANIVTWKIIDSGYKFSEALHDYDIMGKCVTNFLDKYNVDVLTDTGVRNPMRIPEAIGESYYYVNDEAEALGVHAYSLCEKQELAELAQDTDKRLSAALEQASHVLSRIDNVAKETEMTVVSARGVVSKNSTTVIELNQAIREITEAARAVRVFANTLERNPEAVLRGKVR